MHHAAGVGHIGGNLSSLDVMLTLHHRVLGADDPSRGQQIVACVVAEPQGSIAELAVRRFCAARLAPHKVPRAIVFVDAIPVTARGKIDRAALDGIVRARLTV